MSTVRRLYFYALTLISIEVVIWGAVNLLRTIASRGLIGGGSLLATGLSLVLVGTPIFILHWRAAQKDAREAVEEQASRIRAVFLYAVLAAALIPIVYAVLALMHRELTVLLGGSAINAWFGGEGSLSDNLLAILVNGIAFAYFWFVLRGDWRAQPSENHLADARRLYRYLWVLFGLTLTVAGVYNLLRFIFNLPGSGIQDNAVTMSGAVSLLAVGLPLWAYHWNAVQAALIDPDERNSQLRLIVLYLISLSGVIGVMSAGGRVLNALIRWISGEPNTLGGLLRGNSAELAAAAALGVMWWYYGRILRKEVTTVSDQPRREGLGRLYDYILSLIGLAVTYAGLITLVDLIAQILFGRAIVGTFRGTLSGGLSAVLVGLPVWLIPWRAMQREAARTGSAGDHARRSVLRRIYLYLVLFLLMIGTMGFAGQLLYTLINALLVRAEPNLAVNVTAMFLSLLVTGTLLVYHFRSLRQDNRIAQKALGNLHAAYPTLILVEDGDTPQAAVERAFADNLVQELGRIAPRLPIAVHSMDRGAPDESMLEAKAILLPGALVLEPPEPLRLWLNEFHGLRVLIPFDREDWLWLGQSRKRPEEMAHEAADALRQMAEGVAVRPGLPNNPWIVAGYILGGVFGLILLAIVFSVLVSSVFR